MDPVLVFSGTAALPLFFMFDLLRSSLHFEPHLELFERAFAFLFRDAQGSELGLRAFDEGVIGAINFHNDAFVFGLVNGDEHIAQVHELSRQDTDCRSK